MKANMKYQLKTLFKLYPTTMWAIVLFIFLSLLLILSLITRDTENANKVINITSVENTNDAILNMTFVDLNITDVGAAFGGYLTSVYINITNMRDTRLNPEFFIEVDDESGRTICSQRKIPEETNLLSSILPEYKVSNGELILEKDCYIKFIGDEVIKNYTIEIQIFDAKQDKPSLLALDKKKFSCLSFSLYASPYSNECWILEEK